jgi:hypothetical protein
MTITAQNWLNFARKLRAKIPVPCGQLQPGHERPGSGNDAPLAQRADQRHPAQTSEHRRFPERHLQ